VCRVRSQRPKAALPTGINKKLNHFFFLRTADLLRRFPLPK
jgi:hypothetical protein